MKQLTGRLSNTVVLLDIPDVLTTPCLFLQSHSCVHIYTCTHYFRYTSGSQPNTNGGESQSLNNKLVDTRPSSGSPQSMHLQRITKNSNCNHTENTNTLISALSKNIFHAGVSDMFFPIMNTASLLQAKIGQEACWE